VGVGVVVVGGKSRRLGFVTQLSVWRDAFICATWLMDKWVGAWGPWRCDDTRTRMSRVTHLTASCHTNKWGYLDSPCCKDTIMRPCCSLLQFAVVCCSVLQCAAVCYRSDSLGYKDTIMHPKHAHVYTDTCIQLRTLTPPRAHSHM